MSAGAAIREIFKANTDREIALPLRQSYRVLNLHKRRWTGRYHREPWTDYELKLTATSNSSDRGCACTLRARTLPGSIKWSYVKPHRSGAETR